METDDAGVYHFTEISVHPRRGYPVSSPPQPILVGIYISPPHESVPRWEMDAVPFVVACGWPARWRVYVKHGKMVHSRGGGVGYARREVLMSVVRIESNFEGMKTREEIGRESDEGRKI